MLNLYRYLASTLLLSLLAACAATPQPSAPTSTETRPTLLPTATPTTASSGEVVAIADMLAKRAAHTATRLPDGKVLILGGFNNAESALASAEIYDPASRQFSPAGAMQSARQSHSATLLTDGRVLIAGGYNQQGDYLASAELYDPRTAAFTLTAAMTTTRAGHRAVLLADGRLLLVGGVGTGWTFLDSAEIYDPATGRFTATGAMTTARESHTATLLNDGTVLIAGGHKGRGAAIIIYASAEIYDPKRGMFAATNEMRVIRHKHDALRLDDGRVLVVGGSDARDDAGQYNSAEIYDPRTRLFAEAGKLNAARYKLEGTSLVLKNGKVLLMGGASRTELYDPARNTFSAISTGAAARLFATTTLLSDGSVLLVGGYGPGISASANAWLYRP